MVSYGINLLKNHCFYGFFFGGDVYLEILLFCAFFAQNSRRLGNLKRISLRLPCTIFT